MRAQWHASVVLCNGRRNLENTLGISFDWKITSKRMMGWKDCNNLHCCLIFLETETWYEEGLKQKLEIQPIQDLQKKITDQNCSNKWRCPKTVSVYIRKCNFFYIAQWNSLPVVGRWRPAEACLLESQGPALNWQTLRRNKNNTRKKLLQNYRIQSEFNIHVTFKSILTCPCTIYFIY